MGNIATTTNTQILQLIQRGLIINNERKAKETLLDIGYYRLGFYWHYFQSDTTNHIFQAGVTFDDVVNLYYFDFDLKYLLSKYLYRIEVHFRTQIVYWASNKYVHDNKWYRNRQYVNESLFRDFDRMYNRLKRDVPTLFRHHNVFNVSHAPAWKTFEFLSFGQVFLFYKNLKDVTLKNDIAAIYGLTNYTFLENYMKAIINIRNICSHNGTLYDYNQPTGINRINNRNYNFLNRDSSSMNASFILILFMLGKISSNREAEMKTNLISLMNNYDSNPIINSIINNEIKFAL